MSQIETVHSTNQRIAAHSQPRRASMGRKRKTKPMDPAEIARLAAERRANPAKWGIDREAMALAANADVTVEEAGHKNVRRAMRWDVFTLMLQRCRAEEFPREHYASVRRLETDLATVHRTQGGGGGHTANGAPDPLQAWLTHDFSISRLLAALRLNGRPGGSRGVLGECEPWAAALLLAILVPEVVQGRRANWHDAVQKITGENDRIERAKVLRRACAELHRAYGVFDGVAREAVAA